MKYEKAISGDGISHQLQVKGSCYLKEVIWRLKCLQMSSGQDQLTIGDQHQVTSLL